MAVRRAIRRPHVEWWVVAAWSSLALVVVAGLAAATGTF
ncbi:molybdopterin oxidoreductase [Cellulomonas sp. DKR-3]|uniref:Molybdopterin oxidoreductase n=1 Tax=Cellulomonas fulva TaxID=2835530 RepID=A0ABS5TUB7_9CELL|nr:molybdopterin oxidoreductase [Cellulomonas fulva]MBT0992734.1 molybdopterin oxidoreductase [Cellulomonas fulva]